MDVFELAGLFIKLGALVGTWGSMVEESEILNALCITSLPCTYLHIHLQIHTTEVVVDLYGYLESYWYVFVYIYWYMY